MIDMTRDASCTTTSYANCEVWAQADRLGSVVATMDSSGAVIDKYRYSPYGKSGYEGDNGFPFRFTGQKLDPETGLYYYKARYYDPETGRFLQTDPIGYEDQMNLYAYVGNDPVNAWDPDGEKGYLVSRRTGYRDHRGRYLNHMFVVVIDDNTGEVTRFSYGPQRYNPLAFGKLVSVTDTGDPTDLDDIDATAALSDPATAAELGISSVAIDAPDAAIIASGESVDQAVGTRKNPGRVKYAPLTGPQSTSNYGNSNSAAYAVANRAVQSQDPDASQPLPPGSSNPGWKQNKHIPKMEDVFDDFIVGNRCNGRLDC